MVLNEVDMATIGSNVLIVPPCFVQTASDGTRDGTMRIQYW